MADSSDNATDCERTSAYELWPVKLKCIFVYHLEGGILYHLFPPTPYKRLCVRLLTLVQLALFNWKRRPLGPLMIYPSIELNTCRSYKTSRRVLLLLVDPGRRRNRIDHWSLLVEEILLLKCY